MSVSKSRPGMRAAISWVFILATVALMQFPQIRASKLPRDYAQDLSIQTFGKYAIGTRGLQELNFARSSASESLSESLKRYKNTKSWILIVPIIAEFSGNKEAIAELERIQESPADENVKRDIPTFLQLYRDGASSLSSQQRRSIKQYGWLGELALSQEQPDTNPERRAILDSAMRASVLIILMGLGIVAAMGVGIVLLVIAIVFRVQGRLPSRFAAQENPEATLLEAFAIYLAGFGALPLLIRLIFPKFGVATIFAILAVIVGLIWPRLRGSDWKSYRTAVGWHRGRGFFREIGAGIAGYIAGLPLLFIGSVITLMISRFAGKLPAHPIIFEINRSPLYTLLWTLLACVWAPIIEETFFRGVFFAYLRRRFSFVFSGIIVGLLFAAIHPQGWAAIPMLGVIGFNLCAIREWRGSLVASMSAHALNNASAVLALVFILG